MAATRASPGRQAVPRHAEKSQACGAQQSQGAPSSVAAGMVSMSSQGDACMPVACVVDAVATVWIPSATACAGAKMPGITKDTASRK